MQFHTVYVWVLFLVYLLLLKAKLISRLHNVLSNGYFFSKATFSKSLLFKGPYLYSFTRASFSKDAVFYKRHFSTGNLVEFLYLKVPGWFTEWCTTQKIFPLNTMTKTYIKITFSG